jgi:ribosome biogenesis GTPase / thiamine phosphate phosphatase
LSFDLERLGWSPFFAESFQQYESDGLVPGRVAVEERGSYLVYTEEGERWTGITGRLRHDAAGGADFPAVGDWVALDDRIHAVLPRRTKFSRKVAWQKAEEQVLAANVDVVFLVMALTERDFNPRRLERYLATAWESGAEPVVVLSKADLCEDVPAHLADAEAVAFGVPVHVTSAVTGDGLGELRAHFSQDRTAALLGSSGVGKSTLINAFAGNELLRTNEIRSDGRGRHTTTHRELVRLPGGALLIDTPGIRSLGVAGLSDGIDPTFADIADLALQCRFSDCRHDGEPGCAVQAALADGTLAADRLASHRKLEREAAHVARASDPLLRAEERRKWRAIHVSVNQHMKRKYGSDR